MSYEIKKDVGVLRRDIATQERQVCDMEMEIVAFVVR